jgi:hypothetical protein
MIIKKKNAHRSDEKISESSTPVQNRDKHRFQLNYSKDSVQINQQIRLQIFLFI